MTNQTIDPPVASAEPPSVVRERRVVKVAHDLALRFAMVWCLILLSIIASILYPGFLDYGNIKNILSQNAPVGLVAIGATFVVIGGAFDLSIASVLAAGGVSFAAMSNHMPIGIAALATVAIGAGAGAVNGFIVTRLKVNSFIATLGTSSLFLGGTALYSHSLPISATNKHFGFLGLGTWFGIPVSIFVLAAVFVVGGFVLAKTTYGRMVYAVGGNTEAARLAGMRVNIVRTTTFVVSGMCAALAGMIVASLNSIGQPAIEPESTLNAFTIVIIGGTSLFGGEGAMWRTFVGLLLFGVINNLFESLAWASATQQIVLGAILLIAVALDAYTRSRHRS